MAKKMATVVEAERLLEKLCAASWGPAVRGKPPKCIHSLEEPNVLFILCDSLTSKNCCFSFICFSFICRLGS